MNTLALDLSSKSIKIGLNFNSEETMVFSDTSIENENKTDRLFFFFPIS